MTEVFKNRLIGSAILIVAAIVFLPDLLDGQKQVVKDDFKVVPERPEFAAVAQQQVFAQDQHDASRQQAMTLPTDNSPVLDDPTLNPTDPQMEVAAENSSPQDSLPDQTYATVDTDSVAAKPVGLSSNTEPNVEKVDVAKATSAATTASEKLATPSSTLNQAAWVVKVGSFSKEQNANALVSKLRKAGFTTFTRNITNAQRQTMVSVLVGPDLKKEQLERSLPKLQELAAAKNLKVVAFSPIENN